MLYGCVPCRSQPMRLQCFQSWASGSAEGWECHPKHTLGSYITLAAPATSAGLFKGGSVHALACAAGLTATSECASCNRYAWTASSQGLASSYDEFRGAGPSVCLPGIHLQWMSECGTHASVCASDRFSASRSSFLPVMRVYMSKTSSTVLSKWVVGS